MVIYHPVYRFFEDVSYPYVVYSGSLLQFLVENGGYAAHEVYGKRSGVVSHDVPFKEGFEAVCEYTVGVRVGTVGFQERCERS